MRLLDVRIAVIVALLLCCSCSSSNVANQVAAQNDANIKQVANLYYAYQRGHGWKGPKDEASLKGFVRQDMDPKKLEMMNVNVSKLDDIFISPRDHKPFKIKYGLGGGPGSTIAVAFEESGVNGQRQVGFTGPAVEEVDEAKYTELWGGQNPK